MSNLLLAFLLGYMQLLRNLLLFSRLTLRNVGKTSPGFLLVPVRPHRGPAAVWALSWCPAVACCRARGLWGMWPVQPWQASRDRSTCLFPVLPVLASGSLSSLCWPDPVGLGASALQTATLLLPRVMPHDFQVSCPPRVLSSEAAGLCVFPSQGCSLEIRIRRESGAHICLSSWRSVLCTSFPTSRNYFFKCFVWFLQQQWNSGLAALAVCPEVVNTLWASPSLTGRD